LANKIQIAVRVLREGGPKLLAHRVKRYIGKRVFGWQKVTLSVGFEDVLAADWTNPPKRLSFDKKAKDRLTIHWVVPPAGIGSGGHLNIFRFVRHLESKGHTCRVFYYDPNNSHTQEEADVVIKHFPAMKASVVVSLDGVEDCDAVFATSWQTAYPVFNLKTRARKFYFVQDFEPYFYPTSSESVLAENTYRFGLHGITAGRWLTEKLGADYGMKCDYYDFGSDYSRYHFTNTEKRKGVFFYARPVTPRRGFELGVLALELFHKKHPEYEIHLAGWDIGEYKLGFPFVNHGIMKLSELDGLYNECAAALVISLTNMSLLPLELLAAGCVPVVNDGPNNRLVSDNPAIAYAPMSPRAMADALCEIVEREDQVEYARKASAGVQGLSWEVSGDKLEAAIKRELHG
jgi:glycosyltransferase involved in cell wall biosynthesis